MSHYIYIISVALRYPFALAVSTPIELAAATCRNPVLPVSGVTRPRFIVRLAADDAVSMTANNVTTTSSCVIDDVVLNHVTCDTAKLQT